MRYRLIDEEKPHHAVLRLACVLGVFACGLLRLGWAGALQALPRR